jgi:PAS domain S-box-containing protein/putative nucleotidyltransferase with HDIG domain
MKPNTPGARNKLLSSSEQSGSNAQDAVLDYSHSAILSTARQWQLAVDAIVDPIFLHDREFRILRANKAYAEAAGMAVQDVIGKYYWDVFPRLNSPLPGCLRTLSEHKTEDKVLLEDGRTFICRNYAVYLDDSVYQFSVHALRDISDERLIKSDNMQLATDLRNADRYISNITDTIPDILFDLDPVSLAPMYVSSAVQRLLGYEPRQLVEEPAFWQSIVHEDDIHRLLEELGCAAAEGRDAMFECRLRHKNNGEYIWLQVRTRAVFDDDGAVSRLIGIATDIRDRRKIAEERIEAAERLSRSLYQSITAITSLLEKRDPYTAGHQRHVAELSVAIASEMGLDADRISGIDLGAQVHDIGKIAVPAEILNRPGKLTVAEFEIIKSHTLIGYDILKVIDFPWPIAEMVRQHHERIDGSGYPDGLRGEDIILEARILAVADVYDAMSSHRPYRPGNGVQHALSEINQYSGIHYDVQVVEAINRLVENDLIPRKKGTDMFYY